MTECKQEVFKFQGQGSAAGSFCRPHEHALDGFQPTAVVVQRVCASHAHGAAGGAAARHGSGAVDRGATCWRCLRAEAGRENITK